MAVEIAHIHEIRPKRLRQPNAIAHAGAAATLKNLFRVVGNELPKKSRIALKAAIRNDHRTAGQLLGRRRMAGFERVNVFYRQFKARGRVPDVMGSGATP